MQDFPRASQNLSPSIRAPDVSHKPLAFPKVGFGHIGTSAHWERLMQIHHQCSRLLTKWAEVEPLATVTEQKIRNFVWRSVICRFGIPRALVSEYGKQFDNAKFRDFCAELGIKNYFSSPTHPQSNGQAEVTIRTCGPGFFTRASPLDGRYSFFYVSLLENHLKKTVLSRHLFLFYFKKGKNKIRKKSPKCDS